MILLFWSVNLTSPTLDRQWLTDCIKSGVRTSGVILSTAFRLFDLNYKLYVWSLSHNLHTNEMVTYTDRYVIANNTIETSSHAQEVNDAILRGILPKMPVDVITIEQAIKALNRSG